MAGMRKEYDPNKGSRRKRRPIIYIICEGKETEPSILSISVLVTAW